MPPCRNLLCSLIRVRPAWSLPQTQHEVHRASTSECCLPRAWSVRSLRRTPPLSFKGQSYTVRKGKTPILTPDGPVRPINRTCVCHGYWTSHSVHTRQVMGVGAAVELFVPEICQQGQQRQAVQSAFDIMKVQVDAAWGDELLQSPQFLRRLWQPNPSNHGSGSVRAYICPTFGSIHDQFRLARPCVHDCADKSSQHRGVNNNQQWGGKFDRGWLIRRSDPIEV